MLNREKKIQNEHRLNTWIINARVQMMIRSFVEAEIFIIFKFFTLFLLILCAHAWCLFDLNDSAFSFETIDERSVCMKEGETFSLFYLKCDNCVDTFKDLNLSIWIWLWKCANRTKTKTTTKKNDDCQRSHRLSERMNERTERTHIHVINANKNKHKNRMVIALKLECI